MKNKFEFNLHPQLAADSLFMLELNLCQLRLINDSQFPWFILVPKRANISEIYQLSDNDRQRLWQESDSLSRLLMEHFNGDKLNVAALGNMVPQLHLHHVVRFKSDPCWPAPIWGQLPMIAYNEQKVSEIGQLLQEKLANL